MGDINIPHDMVNYITYQFLKFNSVAVEIWE